MVEFVDEDEAVDEALGEAVEEGVKEEEAAPVEGG